MPVPNPTRMRPTRFRCIRIFANRLPDTRSSVELECRLIGKEVKLTVRIQPEGSYDIRTSNRISTCRLHTMPVNDELNITPGQASIVRAAGDRERIRTITSGNPAQPKTSPEVIAKPFMMA